MAGDGSQRCKPSCKLTPEEQAALAAADAMLAQYGDGVEMCALLIVCGDMSDIGAHERAWCHMVGAGACIAARNAQLRADLAAGKPQFDEDFPSRNPAYSDVKWNARNHGTWMASLVASGAVSPEEALQLAWAHEIDSVDHGRSTFGSKDSRIDMVNNRVGIEIGKQMRARYMPTTEVDISAQVEPAMAPGCTGLCFSLESRYA